MNLYYFTLIILLTVISIIDFLKYIIPNLSLIFGGSICILLNIIGKGVGLAISISGCIIMVVFTYIIAFILKKIFKEECIGFGDIKLFGMIGLYLGANTTIIIYFFSLYIASFIGISYVIYSKFKYGEYNEFVPFAPMISLATLFVLLIK
nr:prepilin peptidase [Clostridioides sp.]